MMDTAGEVRNGSLEMYSPGPQQTDKKELGDKLAIQFIYLFAYLIVV